MCVFYLNGLSWSKNTLAIVLFLLNKFIVIDPENFQRNWEITEFLWESRGKWW